MRKLATPVLMAALFSVSAAWAAPKGSKRPAPPPPAVAAPAAPAPEAAPVAPAPEAAPAPAPAPAAPAPAVAVPAPTPVAPPPAAVPPPAEEGQETVALLPINAPEPGLSTSATAQVAQGLRDLRVFRVMDPESIAGLLGAEAMRQGVGCTDQSCLAELAGAVGAKYFVSGTISRTGEDYTINLVLTDQRTAQNVDGALHTEKGVAGVGAAMRKLAQRVVQKLLSDKQGTLRLIVTEKGADVKIDDVLVGATPLAPRQLPMGPHKLSVEKDGFIAMRQDVFMKANDTSIISGTLIPNQDFINAYKRKNILLLAGGVVSTVAAVGGVVGFFLLESIWMVTFYMAQKDQPAVGTFLTDRVFTWPPVTQSSDINDLGNEYIPTAFFNGLGIAAALSLVAVIPAGLVAALFYFLAENPGRYSVYSAE